MKTMEVRKLRLCVKESRKKTYMLILCLEFESEKESNLAIK
jgi:hypothetical protein